MRTIPPASQSDGGEVLPTSGSLRLHLTFGKGSGYGAKSVGRDVVQTGCVGVFTSDPLRDPPLGLCLLSSTQSHSLCTTPSLIQINASGRLTSESSGLSCGIPASVLAFLTMVASSSTARSKPRPHGLVPGPEEEPTCSPLSFRMTQSE